MSDTLIVRKKIEYLQSCLGMPLKAFVASDEELLWISGDRFNSVAIYNLVSHIMIHLKAAFVRFTINLQFIDETNRPGEYSNKGGPVINLRLSRDYTTEQIIAIVCHECTHHYLFSKGIRLEDEHENEILTDVAAIYLGFGNYIAEGYKPTQKIVSYTSNGHVIRTSKIGYLSERQITIAINEVNRLVTGDKAFSSRLNEKIQKNKTFNDNNLQECALKDCETLKMLVNVNSSLVTQICAEKKAVFSKNDYVVFQDNLRKNDNQEYYLYYERCIKLIDNLKSKKDYKVFEEDINKICTEIAYRNNMLGRYI